MKKFTSKLLVAQESLPDGFYRATLQGLFLKTGKIAIGDPFFMPDTPLKNNVPIGRYAVDLIFKDCGDWGNRVAVALLKLNENLVCKWTPAKNNFGFVNILVDSGLACIADMSTVLKFNELLVEFRSATPPKNYYDLVLEHEIRNKIFEGPRISSLVIHKPFNNEENMAIFESGLGDGVYRTYWGKDNNGEPCAFMIDFDIMDV